MNHLKNWQISFKKFNFNGDAFRISFISKRLAKLITKKNEHDRWKVLQVPVVKNYIVFFEYSAVFVSPTHGTMLLIKDGNK